MMIKMKWNVQACLLGFLLAFVGVSFAGCSEDEEGNYIGNGDSNNVNVTASQLYGTWSCVGNRGWIQEPGKGKETWENDLVNDGLFITLYSNGSVLWEYRTHNENYTETWSLANGNTLLVDGDSYTITSFTGNKMIIESYDESGEETVWEQVTFQKVN